MSIEGQGHFLTLAQGHLHLKIKTGFSQKPLDQSKPNFICKLSGTGGAGVTDATYQVSWQSVHWFRSGKFFKGFYHMSHDVRKPDFAYAKTKTQISFAVTAKLISAFVFASRLEQSLCLLNSKFQASSSILWLYNPVCVGPGRKPRRPVF